MPRAPKAQTQTKIQKKAPVKTHAKLSKVNKAKRLQNLRGYSMRAVERAVSESGLDKRTSTALKNTIQRGNTETVYAVSRLLDDHYYMNGPKPTVSKARKFLADQRKELRQAEEIFTSNHATVSVTFDIYVRKQSMKKKTGKHNHVLFDFPYYPPGWTKKNDIVIKPQRFIRAKNQHITISIKKNNLTFTNNQIQYTYKVGEYWYGEANIEYFPERDPSALFAMWANQDKEGFNIPVDEGYEALVKITNITEHKQEQGVNREQQVLHDDTAPNLCHRYLGLNSNLTSNRIKDIIGSTEKNDYLKKFYKENSCVISCLLQLYKEPIEKLQNRNTKPLYKQYQMTYEGIWNIVCPGKMYDKDSALGVTIDQALNFFKIFRLKATFITPELQIIKNYEPTSINKDINPRSPIFIVHNNHCYYVNDNTKIIEQGVLCDKMKKTSICVKPSNKYKFNKYDIPPIYLNSFSEFPTIDFESFEGNSLLVLCQDDPKEIMNYLLNYCNYEPFVCATGTLVTSIIIKVGKINVTLKSPTGITNVAQYFPNEEYFKLFNMWEKKLYNETINKLTMSTYSESLKYAIHNYYRRPMVARFVKKCSEGQVRGYDIGKAYLNAFLSMSYIPVFTSFDKFQIYNDEKVRKYSLYFVKKIKNFDKNIIALPYKYNLVTGNMLINCTSNLLSCVKIMYVIHPAKVVVNTSKKTIEKLYKSELSDDHKKFIPNKIFGLMEKKFNSVQSTRLFLDYNEACEFKKKYKNSTISKIPMGGIKLPTDNTNIVEHPKHDLEHQITDHNAYRNFGKKYIYMVYIKKTTELDNGFLPLKLYILINHALRMQNLANEIELAGGTVYGIKTDCLITNIEYIHKGIEKPKNIWESIGRIRHEKAQPSLKKYKFTVNTNNMIIDPPVPPVRIHISDEWDTKSIIASLIQHPSTIVRADLPGSGKSYIFKQLAKTIGMEKVLFVVPTNELVRGYINEGFNSVTANKCLGMLYTPMDGVTEKKPLDILPYEYIVFDEIYFLDLEKLEKIHEMILAYPEIMYFAAGDLNQNEPIDCSLFYMPKDKYYEQCIDNLFPTYILLHESKRLQSDTDKEKIQQIKNAIFNPSNKKFNPSKVCKKFFKPLNSTAEIEGHCITYLNKTKQFINTTVHESKGHPKNAVEYKKIHYYPGLELRATKQYSASKVTTYTNFVYILTKIDDKQFTISDPTTKETFTIPIKYIADSFSLNHARTGHSCQGATFDGAITIFDVNFKFVSPKWLWTAVTRTTDLSNIYYCDNLSHCYEAAKLKQFVQTKIISYQAIDNKKKLYYDINEYVTYEWVEKYLYETFWYCTHCNEIMDLSNSMSQLSINRLDNDLPHIKSNCVLSCLSCNHSYRDGKYHIN